jgi:hypothetical protein
MNVEAVCLIDNTLKPMEMLINPDSGGDWAIRYLWIQHRDDNETFTKNYFVQGSTQGMNIRKQTTHLQSTWKNHNAVFDQSAQNGDLIWRVKVFNPISNSIDYVEVWKNIDIIVRLFDTVAVLDDGNEWSNQEKQDLGLGIWNAGFCVRHLRPYTTISKNIAIAEYKKFVAQYKNKDNCIINTPMKQEDLNG